MRSYAGQQEVDWPGVVYKLMPSQEYGLYGWPAVEIPAMRCALGLEPTPEAYIGHLVLCFREVKRVLREDGVAWVVMGDSFCSEGGQRQYGSYDGGTGRSGAPGPRISSAGLQQGDLMLIPHRLALALQADGWLVRNDAVWAKVAPMPESVSGWRWERCRVKVKDLDGQRGGSRTNADRNDAGVACNLPYAQYAPCPGCDKCRATGGYVLRRGSWRHTRAHETVLMLAKGMNYYADQERVREENAESTQERAHLPRKASSKHGARPSGDGKSGHSRVNYGAILDASYASSGRNPRSVLTPRPESYSGAHYAVYPRTLISPLLRATAPTRVCPVCGAPWCPVVEKTPLGAQLKHHQDGHRQTRNSSLAEPVNEQGQQWSGDLLSTIGAVLSHRPTCDCGRHQSTPYGMNWATPEPIPGWCLDPFAGTGTTLEVCAELGVNAVGLDISPQYLDEHAKPRIGLMPSKALDNLPLFEGLT